jgi:ribosomal protein S18 acetylase RimI-like enzyme
MIRIAKLEDLDLILTIEKQFGEEAFSKSSLRRFILNERLLVYCQNEIVGYAIVLLRSNSNKARLYSIAVAEQYQGKGYGSAILTAAESLAIKKGRSVMILEVASRNVPARSLYNMSGYTPIAEFDNYYKNGDSAIRMEKKLLLRPK